MSSFQVNELFPMEVFKVKENDHLFVMQENNGSEDSGRIYYKVIVPIRNIGSKTIAILGASHNMKYWSDRNIFGSSRFLGSIIIV